LILSQGKIALTWNILILFKLFLFFV